jgi:hypothetical protein
MKIQISPVSVFPSIATQVEFLPAEIAYGQSARCQYILQDEAGGNLTSARVEMTPEQYALWGDDDSYAADTFLANLGLVRA